VRTPRSPTGDDTATATAMSGAASIAQEMVIIKVEAVEGVGARAEVRRCYIVYTVTICWELCASFGKYLTVGTV
jgi:hypothetical protein